MPDEKDYFLNVEFDPSSYTKAQLREVLLKHDLDPPTNVRKSAYIDLFNEHVKPLTPKLREEYLSMNPSSENIENASARSRSESPVRRSTRLRSKSPTKRPNSATSSGAVASGGRVTKTTPATHESPRRQKINKKVVLPDQLEELPPNTEDFDIPGPRTRSRSPHRLQAQESPVAAQQPLRSPRRKKAVAASPEKTPARKPDEEAPRGRTPTRPSSGSQTSSPFTQENVFQQRKRVGDHLDEERPPKQTKTKPRAKDKDEIKTKKPVSVPAVPLEPKESSKVSFEVEDDEDNKDLFSKYTHLAEDNTGLDVEERASRPSTSERRGFLPSLNSLKAANLFPPRSAPEDSSSTLDSGPVVKQDASVEEVPKSSPETKKHAKKNQHREPVSPRTTTKETKRRGSTARAATELKVEPVEEKATLPSDATAVDARPESTVDAESDVGTEDDSAMDNIRFYFFKGVLLLAQILSLSMAFSLAIWWRSERIKQGFCDSSLIPPEREYPWFINYPVEDVTLQHLQEYSRRGFDLIAPNCIPCPRHATCYDNGVLECDDGYVFTQTPLSMLGLTAPRCARDVERDRLLATLAERAVHILRSRRAQYECKTEGVTSPEMTEDQLYNELLRLKAPQLSDDEFQQLWGVVSLELNKYPDVEMGFPSHGSTAQADDEYDGINSDEPVAPYTAPIFVSHSLAHVSLSCQLKLGALQWIKARQKSIALIGSLMVFGTVIGSLVAFLRKKKRQVSRALQQVLETLRAQQRKADTDRTGITVRYAVAGPLLETVPKALRSDVEAAVIQHKDVRCRQLEIHGEITTVYEWTGI